MGIASSVGGFFVEIAAKVDNNSFDKGEKKIGSLGASVSKLIGTVTAASAALVGMATIAGNAETKELKLANSIGISVDKLDQWKVAANVAGTSADGLLSSMDALNTKMQGLKLGQVDMNLAKNLGFMGIGYQQFANMDGDQRMKEVFNKALGMEDQSKAATLVGNILGSAGADYYNYLQLSGKSLESQLAQAKKLNFTDERSKREAMEFNAEIKGLISGVKSIGSLIASKIGGQLTPIVRKIKDVMAANHDLIVSGITGFIEGFGTLLNNTMNTIGRFMPYVSQLIDRFGGLDKVIIKVGIGIAAMKITKMATGILGVVRGIGLLKMSLAGLGFGALLIIADDLFSYFSKDGRRSLTGVIMNHADEIKAKFQNMFPTLNLDSLKNAIMSIQEPFAKLKTWIDAAKDSSDELKKIWGDVKNIWFDAFGTVLQNSINSVGRLISGVCDVFSWLLDLADAISRGGLSGGAKFIKESAAEQIDKISGSSKDAYNKARKEGKGLISSLWEGVKAGVDETPIVGDWTNLVGTAIDNGVTLGKATAATIKAEGESIKVISDTHKKTEDKKREAELAEAKKAFSSNSETLWWDDKKFLEEYRKMKSSTSTPKSTSEDVTSGSRDEAEGIGWARAFSGLKTKKVDDGIISPNGKVTQVAPDDWVFAAKDLGNLASAFIPRGFGNINNSMSSPVVVNQTFSFTGSSRELVPAVKQQAYRGTNDALLVSMKNSQRILQQMNGTR